MKLISWLLVGMAVIGCAPQDIGEECSGDELGPGEVQVEESGECAEGAMCLSYGPGIHGDEPLKGMCSCRCDGPQGTGPFCTCADGYVCTPLVDEGLGLNAEEEGSYCVRE